MIQFSELSNKLKERLFTLGNEYDLNFHIVNDTGEYKEPERYNNTVIDYVNGVIKLTSSDLSKLSDGTVVSTQTAKLDIIIRLPDISADEEFNGHQYETVEDKINKVRSVLNKLTQESSYEKMTDADSIEYSVSTIYQSATTGERNIVAHVGDSFTFTLFAYYMIIQGGLNSSNIVFNIDGYVLPYQTMTINRSITYDSNVYSNTTDGAIENVPIQSNWSVSFELPALKSGFFENIVRFIFGNDKLNTVHCLNIDLDGSNKAYLVTLAETNLNGESYKNAGLKLVFFEAVNNYYLISLPSNAKVFRAIGSDEDYSGAQGNPMRSLKIQGYYFIVKAIISDPIFVSKEATGHFTTSVLSNGDLIVVVGSAKEAVGLREINE